MTEYEVYSYEAFRKKYQDDIREVPRASLKVLDQELLETYINRLKAEKPNISALADETIYELMSITKDGMVTLSSLLLFCKYPQAYFPQLCITAVVLPGDDIGDIGGYGERFVDNKRIEGNLPEMLDQALAFVRKNMRIKTIINPNSGKREDRTDYPIIAVREALLNTLVHRDYSIHTEGMPIQILMYPDRIEIRNPGGIYGRLRVDQLGKMQPDTRNPVLVTALEVMGLTENRYSGIPTIRRSMKDFNLEDPVFADERGTFTVILYNRDSIRDNTSQRKMTEKEEELLNFLKIPRSRNEIAEYLGIGTIAYVMQTYINPLVEKGLVRLTIPEKPKSPKQRFVRK
jgi:ATP-dependent DNA helicase RecG